MCFASVKCRHIYHSISTRFDFITTQGNRISDRREEKQRISNLRSLYRPFPATLCKRDTCLLLLWSPASILLPFLSLLSPASLARPFYRLCGRPELLPCFTLRLHAFLHRRGKLLLHPEPYSPCSWIVGWWCPGRRLSRTVEQLTSQKSDLCSSSCHAAMLLAIVVSPSFLVYNYQFGLLLS
jgi:hypothetical protein